jgi:hypothetical protein
MASITEIQKSGEHIFYEIMMMQGCATVLGHGIFESGIVRHAIMNSFTIHARNIIYFLYPPQNKQQDDMDAQDFVKHGIVWADIRPEKSELLKQINFRVGKEIAHLTYERTKITAEDKAWTHVQINKEIREVFKKYLEVSRTELFGEYYNNYIHGVGIPVQILKPVKLDFTLPLLPPH